MYVTYQVPGESEQSFVPMYDNNGKWAFADAAYDVFDVFYIKGEEENTGYFEFEDALLSAMPELVSNGTAVINVRGIEFKLGMSED